MMKRFILTPLLALLFIPAFCQQPYRQQLGDVAFITFPDTPRQQLSKGLKVYTGNVGDTIVLATIAPLNQYLGVFGSSLNTNYYTGVIAGALREAHGKLFYRKPIKTNGIEGVEFAYRAVFDSVKYFCYHQAYNINNNLVFYGYWIRDSVRTPTPGMKKFFGSLELTPAAFKTDNTKMLSAVRTVGIVILVVILVVGIGLAIFFILRRRAAR